LIIIHLQSNLKIINRLAAIFNYKCPRCRKGDLFAIPLNIKQPLDMHKRCQVCDLDFEPEPGFYFGAMFISYTISAFILLPVALLAVFKYGWSANQAMLLMMGIGAVGFLKILRISRSAWLNAMVPYDPDYIKK
jgi:uncharacterized protein (DUF983 family)